jgi:hypothetical protein
VVADDLRMAADTGDGELARTLGRLLYARRFLGEARERYAQAAALAPATAADDLRAAADVAIAEARADLAFELLRASASVAGDGHRRATSLAYAVALAGRAPAMFPAPVPLAERDAMLAEARAAAPPDDPLVDAYLASAAAWHVPDPLRLDPALAKEALATAERADDPALISAALDAVAAVTASHGRLREAYRLCLVRVDLLARMPRHNPRYGLETFDTAYMAVEMAIASGDLAGALAIAEAARDDDIAGGLPHGAASKPLIPLVLMGRFDEAVDLAEAMWDGWQRSGAPAAGWMSAAAYAVTIPFGLRGDADGVRLWQARAQTIVRPEAARSSRSLASFATFADARVALHTGDHRRAADLLSNVDSGTFSWAYAAAATAELAVVAGLPYGEALDAAGAVAAENDWAAACLARIRGRLGDAAALREALDRWEALGAGYELACTLLLIPGREAEGGERLAALGVPRP